MKCPKCNGKAVPIVYGLPNEKAGRKAERGEIFLGGCCVTDHDPQWHCKKCGHEFNPSNKNERRKEK